MPDSNLMISPIVKWVGGKRQLLSSILPLVPQHTTYCEPFVGGGAVFFSLQPKNSVINDSNAELINLYKVVAEAPGPLIELLERHRAQSSKEYFYAVRAMDRDKARYAALSDVERAARILYLNKTCYNGLFRVNSAGEFNVPWGRYKNPNITNEAAIRAMHAYLARARVKMLTGDYRAALKGLRRGAFAYLDPPYMPISASSYFTGYTPGGFDEAEQVALKKQCDALDKKGVKFLLSNSSCAFIEELYSDYVIERVSAKRAINAVAQRRGAIDEVLIRNYECAE